ncbi:MAG: hypothetical protein L7S56_03540 [Candidatus Poseidonia sp.]|nr:hypothetical protein [Poseidonia sp.]
MQPYALAVEVWCEETWGETPKSISEWAVNSVVTQVFIRLSSSVLIADFERSENDALTIRQHLHIPLETWNPGSIQAIRTSEGRIRFTHRRSVIYLSNELRSPDGGAALLEEWLMGMRGEIVRPKDRQQRIDEMKRMRTSVERHLEAASLHQQRETMTSLGGMVDSMNHRLADK